jgi:hypothetical protein
MGSGTTPPPDVRGGVAHIITSPARNDTVYPYFGKDNVRRCVARAAPSRFRQDCALGEL